MNLILLNGYYKCNYSKTNELHEKHIAGWIERENLETVPFLLKINVVWI